MPNTWIVAADASRARVLQVRGPQRLVEIDNLLEVGAVEHLEEAFAKRVGDYLDKARTEHRYDELVLVAPPKFLGMKDLSWFNERELEAYFRESPPGSAQESGRAP